MSTTSSDRSHPGTVGRPGGFRHRAAGRPGVGRWAYDPGPVRGAMRALRLVAGKESFQWRRPGVRAVVIREFGPPEVLEPAEVAEVRAGPDEVVIEVEF